MAHVDTPAFPVGLFEALAESAPDAIVTIDESSRILFANSSVERVLGYHPGELVGRSLAEVIPHRMRQAHRDGVARYLRTGSRNVPWTGLQLPALRKDGVEIPVEISFGEIGSDGHRVFSGFIRDVSERVRYQQELEAARAQAESALRELRTLHAITDAAIAQRSYERMLEELLRRIRQELTVDSATLLLLDEDGTHLLVAATEGFQPSDFAPRTFRVGQGIVGKIAATGQPLMVEDVHGVPNVHPTVAATTRSMIGVPVMMEGTVIGVLVAGSATPRTFTDLEQRILAVVADRMAGVLARTRMYQAERAARDELASLNQELKQRAAEERALRTVAEHIAAATNATTVMQEIVKGAIAISGATAAYVEQVFERSGEVEIVATAGDLVPPAGIRVPYPGSLSEELIARREPSLLARMEGVGFSMAPYLARYCPSCSALVVPLLAEQSVLGALVLVCGTDDERFLESGVVNRARTLGDLASLALQRLTALRESESRRAEAESAVRSRDEVLSIVSHDLRNPVSTVAMSAQLLRDPLVPLSEAQRNQQLDIILRSAQRMNRLIQDLLDVTRMEGGRFTVNCRCEDAASLAAEARDAFSPLVADKGIRFTGSQSEYLPRIYVDRDRVLQVLSNYLGNAAKFTPTGGEIRMAVEFSAGEVRFTVSDTGPGIHPSELPHVFSRFWQAKRTAHLGAGLGLAIAKGIADAHKGRVWVESQPGQGSVFGFAVPVGEQCSE